MRTTPRSALLRPIHAGLLALLTVGALLAPGCASAERGSNSARVDSSAPSQPAHSAGALSDNSAQSTDEPAKAQAQPAGPAYLLRMVDYRSKARFELVNHSHTAPLAQYSKKRPDPSRKVASDEWMTGLLAYFRENGWDKEVRDGAAPAGATGSLLWSLELVGPEGTKHIAEPTNASDSQRKRLRIMWKAFLDTYNQTPGYQAVEIRDGKLPFKQPELPGKGRGR